MSSRCYFERGPTKRTIRKGVRDVAIAVRIFSDYI